MLLMLLLGSKFKCSFLMVWCTNYVMLHYIICNIKKKTKKENRQQSLLREWGTHLEKSCTKKYHFHPHASMTKHAPESNEEDYAFYLSTVHESDRPKDTWHIWQVRRVSLIDPLFIFQTTVFLWQHSEKTTLKLVQSSVFSPCINSFRSKEGTREGVAIVTETMYADTHRNAQTQTPHTSL